MFFYIRNKLQQCLSVCRKKKRAFFHSKETFLQACEKNYIVEYNLTVNSQDIPTLESGFKLCVDNNSAVIFDEMVKLNIPFDYNYSLKVACEKGYYKMAEISVQKGADIMTGIRICKFTTISKMLFRYKQKTENIT